MFIIMFIGAFIKKAGLITTEETKKFNKIVFILRKDILEEFKRTVSWKMEEKL